MANLIKTFPYRKWKPSQKNSPEHNAKINGSWGASSSGYTYITAPASLAEETLWKRGKKDSKDSIRSLLWNSLLEMVV